MNNETEKQKLYLETTISSYLTARQSRDVIQLARQQITAEWWNSRLNDFDVFISQIVIDEASSGDPDAARKRMKAIQPFPLLEITDEVTELSEIILRKGVIPEKGARDATHIAVSVCHGMNFLLTWNCRHIANAEKIKALEKICKSEGHEFPVICTPEEFSERS